MSKHTITSAVAIALLAATTGQLAAQQTNQADTTRNLVKLEKLEEASVANLQGENLGEIEELLVDPNTGRIRYAVIEVDKAWSWNDPKVIVPFQALNITSQNTDDVKVTLNATKEKLQNAPKANDKQRHGLYDRQASQPYFSYWAITWFDDTPEEKNRSGSRQTPQSPSSSASPRTSPSPSPTISPNPKQQ